MQHFVLNEFCLLCDLPLESFRFSDTFFFSVTDLVVVAFVLFLFLFVADFSKASGVGIGALGISSPLKHGRDLGPSNDALR